MVRRVDPALVREIIAAHGLRPLDVEELVGRGVVNRVFVVRTESDPVVVRIAADSLRADEFEVEEWCLGRATEYGIPGPHVIARGNILGTTYLIESFIQGRCGIDEASVDTWRLLAEYGEAVQAIPVTDDAPQGLFSRFGRNPRVAWDAHLAYNLDQLEENDPLLRLKVYRAEQQDELRAELQA